MLVKLVKCGEQGRCYHRRRRRCPDALGANFARTGTPQNGGGNADGSVEDASSDKNLVHLESESLASAEYLTQQSHILRTDNHNILSLTESCGPVFRPAVSPKVQHSPPGPQTQHIRSLHYDCLGAVDMLCESSGLNLCPKALT